jgi:rRNA maturation endonuclease Nob1
MQVDESTERQVKTMDDLKNRLVFLEKEVAAIKEQLEGQPMKLQECGCGRSIHHEDAKFCGNCGSSLT